MLEAYGILSASGGDTSFESVEATAQALGLARKTGADNGQVPHIGNVADLSVPADIVYQTATFLMAVELAGAGLAGLASRGAAQAEGQATGFLGHKGFELQNLQAVRNAPATIEGRQYAGHALDQMQNRGIMPSVVENTISTGRSFAGKRAGTTGHFDAVNNVQVIVNSASGRVVTVIPGAP